MTGLVDNVERKNVEEENIEKKIGKHRNDKCRKVKHRKGKHRKLNTRESKIWKGKCRNGKRRKSRMEERRTSRWKRLILFFASERHVLFDYTEKDKRQRNMKSMDFHLIFLSSDQHRQSILIANQH